MEAKLKDFLIPFDDRVAESGGSPLRASGIDVLQVNVGKMCNQTCRHCHVDAGPHRTEIMTRETMAAVLDVVERHRIPVVDITGGAPELNPHFEWFVPELRKRGAHVMDRCNLTILLTGGREGLAAFLRDHQVEIIASLPYYREQNVDAQRGRGVFEASLRALRLLNDLGYGRAGTGLLLNLVFNPTGAYLPPPQDEVEAEYKRELETRFGIVFNRLYTIANMPINRFLDYLHRSGNYERYMRKLIDGFNPAAAANVMCRTTLSVGWDGTLYDCDFNQMLDLPVGESAPRTIAGFDRDRLAGRPIVTGLHCYGCTAGAGSSCGGAIAD